MRQVLIFLKSGQCIELNGVEAAEARQFLCHFRAGVDFPYDLADECGVVSGYFKDVEAVVLNKMEESRTVGFNKE